MDRLRVAMVTAMAGMGCMRAYVVCFILSVLVRGDGVWEVRATSITGGSVPGGPHISNLNVLLPPRSSRPVHYHLQGYNGCFTWFVSLSSLSLLVWDLHGQLHSPWQPSQFVNWTPMSFVLFSLKWLWSWRLDSND